MLYLILIILAVLVAFNVYASRLALRSPLNDRWQRRAQLLLIWLVPLVGSLLAVQVHRGTARGSWLGAGASSEPEEAWYLSDSADDCPPGDPGCGE